MRAALLVLLVLLAGTVIAQTPMKSFSFQTQSLRCNTEDQLMPLSPGVTFAPPALPGAGVLPRGDFLIRKVCVGHWIAGSQDDSYIVVGHSGVNGDHISPMFAGSQTICMDFPNDAPVKFAAGEYLDIHSACTQGTHWATLQIWFTQ